MTIFLSGGAKNGKSTLAQELAVKLSGAGKRYYVATMIPTDEEDLARIRRHVADRDGLGFETIECSKNMLSCLDTADRDGTFLVDSATALSTRRAWHPPTVSSGITARLAANSGSVFGI